MSSHNSCDNKLIICCKPGSTIKVADTVFVDWKYGDDSTGQPENLSKPFKTLNAGLDAARVLTTKERPFTVFVRPGVYSPTRNLAARYINWWFESLVTINDQLWPFQLNPLFDTSAGSFGGVGFFNIYGQVDIVLDKISVHAFNLSSPNLTNCQIFVKSFLTEYAGLVKLAGPQNPNGVSSCQPDGSVSNTDYCENKYFFRVLEKLRVNHNNTLNTIVIKPVAGANYYLAVWTGCIRSTFLYVDGINASPSTRVLTEFGDITIREDPPGFKCRNLQFENVYSFKCNSLNYIGSPVGGQFLIESENFIGIWHLDRLNVGCTGFYSQVGNDSKSIFNVINTVSKIETAPFYLLDGGNGEFRFDYLNLKGSFFQINEEASLNVSGLNLIGNNVLWKNYGNSNWQINSIETFGDVAHLFTGESTVNINNIDLRGPDSVVVKIFDKTITNMVFGQINNPNNINGTLAIIDPTAGSDIILITGQAWLVTGIITQNLLLTKKINQELARPKLLWSSGNFYIEATAINLTKDLDVSLNFKGLSTLGRFAYMITGSINGYINAIVSHKQSRGFFLVEEDDDPKILLQISSLQWFRNPIFGDIADFIFSGVGNQQLNWHIRNFNTTSSDHILYINNNNHDSRYLINWEQAIFNTTEPIAPGSNTVIYYDGAGDLNISGNRWINSSLRRLFYQTTIAGILQVDIKEITTISPILAQQDSPAVADFLINRLTINLDPLWGDPIFSVRNMVTVSIDQANIVFKELIDAYYAKVDNNGFFRHRVNLYQQDYGTFLELIDGSEASINHQTNKIFYPFQNYIRVLGDSILQYQNEQELILTGATVLAIILVRGQLSQVQYNSTTQAIYQLSNPQGTVFDGANCAGITVSANQINRFGGLEAILNNTPYFANYQKYDVIGQIISATGTTEITFKWYVQTTINHSSTTPPSNAVEKLRRILQSSGIKRNLIANYLKHPTENAKPKENPKGFLQSAAFLINNYDYHTLNRNLGSVPNPAVALVSIYARQATWNFSPEESLLVADKSYINMTFILNTIYGGGAYRANDSYIYLKNGNTKAIQDHTYAISTDGSLSKQCNQLDVDVVNGNIFEVSGANNLFTGNIVDVTTSAPGKFIVANGGSNTFKSFGALRLDLTRAFELINCSDAYIKISKLVQKAGDIFSIDSPNAPITFRATDLVIGDFINPGLFGAVYNTGSFRFEVTNGLAHYNLPQQSHRDYFLKRRTNPKSREYGLIPSATLEIFDGNADQHVTELTYLINRLEASVLRYIIDKTTRPLMREAVFQVGASYPYNQFNKFFLRSLDTATHPVHLVSLTSIGANANVASGIIPTSQQTPPVGNSHFIQGGNAPQVITNAVVPTSLVGPGLINATATSADGLYFAASSVSNELVRIFRRDSPKSVWTQLGPDIDPITAGFLAGGINFGQAVAIQYNEILDQVFVVITASLYGGADEGAWSALIYDPIGFVWGPTFLPIAGDAGDKLGTSIALSYDTAVVLVGSASDKIKVYRGGYTIGYPQVQTLVNTLFIPGSSSDSVDLDALGNTLLVGTTVPGGMGGASTFIYIPSIQSYLADGILQGGILGDLNGYAASLNDGGDVAVLGAPNHGAGIGRVYVYTKAGGKWSAPVIVEAPIGGNFGNSVVVANAGTTFYVSESGPGTNGFYAYRTTDAGIWDNFAFMVSPFQPGSTNLPLSGSQSGLIVGLVHDNDPSFAIWATGFI